jgi:voltage-gated potassium channel Kch
VFSGFLVFGFLVFGFLVFGFLVFFRLQFWIIFKRILLVLFIAKSLQLYEARVYILIYLFGSKPSSLRDHDMFTRF